MATLFIIGNGFDLAHGLSTSYFNLKQYISRKDVEVYRQVNEQLFIGNQDYGHRLNVMWEQKMTILNRGS